MSLVRVAHDVSAIPLRNCCVQTTQRSSRPPEWNRRTSEAAAPVSVTGNTVFERRAHDAILVVSCKGCPVKVSEIRQPCAGNFTGTPIQIEAHPMRLTGNSRRAPRTNGRCIFGLRKRDCSLQYFGCGQFMLRGRFVIRFF